MSRAPLILSAVGAWPTPLSAQEPQDTVPADTVFSVEGVSVQVARPVASAGGASAIQANIDSLRMIPSPTLEDVLRRLPLLQIRENSRGQAQPNVRGMESRRVAVLVDGVPLTLGWDNRTDLSIIPMTAAHSVTLIRGLSSVLHGPNAAGGVVLISIADGADFRIRPPPFQISAAVDHVGSTAVALGLATLPRLGSGDLLLRAGGGYRNRPEFPRPGDVDPALPGQGDARLNSDVEYANVYGVVRYQSDGGVWGSLSSFAYGAQRGVPPELHISEPRLWRYPRTPRWVTAISGGTGWRETPLGQGDLEASFGLDFGDTDVDVFGTLAYDSVTESELGDDRTLTMRLLGDHTLGPGILRSAFTLAETRHIEAFIPGDESRFKQLLWSWGIEVEQPVGSSDPGSGARVSAGISLDYSSTPETGGQPERDPIWDLGARAGGTIPIGSGNVLLHGGLSRRVRFPALRELYSGALGRFVVNPNLDPEVLFVTELGTTAGVPGFEGQATAFYQRLSDAIVRTGLGDGRFQRQNRDVIRTIGLELLANYAWRSVLLAGDLTIQDVDLEDPTAPMGQRRPEYQPWIFGSAEVTVPIPLQFYGTARLRHLGPRYCINPDLDVEQKLEADTWFDLELRRTFSLGAGPRRLEARAALTNSGDAAVFDQCGLPQAGRLVIFQLNLF